MRGNYGINASILLLGLAMTCLSGSPSLLSRQGPRGSRSLLGKITLPQPNTQGPASSSQATHSQQGRHDQIELPSFPVLPFVFDYEHADRYFVERITDNNEYAGIEALIQEGPPLVCDVRLIEKQRRTKVHYTNSEAISRLLADSGQVVHSTPIEYKLVRDLGEESRYVISFRDVNGKLIRWDFVPINDPIDDPDDNTGGLSLIGTPMRVLFRRFASMAAEGTAVQIGETKSLPTVMPNLSFPPDTMVYEGTFCVDATIGGLIFGRQAWEINSAPSQISTGSQWLITVQHGKPVTFRVARENGYELTIEQVDADSARPRLTLTVQKMPTGLAISSISMVGGPSSFRLTFNPALDLAGILESGNKATVGFRMLVGSDNTSIDGVIDVEPKGGQLEIVGHIKEPQWAVPAELKSRVAINRTGYTIECDKTSAVRGSK